MTPDTRALLLENLAAGFTPRRALSHACGKKLPVVAWRELVEMRRVGGDGWDAEVAEACERAERNHAVQGTKDEVRVDADAAVPGDSSHGREHRPPVAPPLHDFWNVAAANEGADPADGAAQWQRLMATVPALAPSPIRPPKAPSPPPPDNPLARFHQEAADSYGPGLFGILQLQEDLLADKRVHRMGPWWLDQFAAFFSAREYMSSLMWILACVGRGGGKSTTLERLAMVVSLFAPRTMSPAERWQWPFISILERDAKNRIFEICKLLQFAYGLDVKVLRAELKIEAEDVAGNAIEFLSMASTIGAVSGPSTMGATVDEAAKMRSTGVNPDVELVVSLAETSRARDHWLGVRCSSAWETRGAHYRDVTAGSNAVNFVATIGPKWIDLALDGFAEVAAWEAAQGNARGATQIRAWARTLTAGSPFVPTWVANTNRSALKSRQLQDTTTRDPEDDDIDPTTYWLRECGSMPLAGIRGFDPMRQLDGLAERNENLAAAMQGRPAQAPGPKSITDADVLRAVEPKRAHTSPVWVPMPWDKGDVF